MSLRFIVIACIGVVIGILGCREAPKPPVAQSAPTQRPVEPVTPPPAEPPPTTKPAPATQPVPATQATRPSPRKAVYEETPPYSVENVVLAPGDPQAGWLRVVTLANEKALASVKGRFPEANHVYVASENVRHLTIDLDMLPLKAKTRRILHIDDQPIELYQAHRGKILLERGTAGRWTVLTKPPAK